MIVTVREALEASNARLVPLQTDARLAGNERALVGSLVTANNNALGALRADNTIVGGQRTARAQQIEDAVHALDTTERAHKTEIGIDELYNAMDLSMDAAGAIRAGLPSFETTL